uniref:Bm11525 n=1 Tax=Brugia malayi TaxID=6279 RepID=A0A1I9G9E9_BRUMA|nr:Bm11525 [Brugia malayi]
MLGNDITKIKMENLEPRIRHVWNGRWEQQPEPEKHIGVMYLKQVMTVMKIPIPLTYSDLQARQVIAELKTFRYLSSWRFLDIVR